MTKIKPPKPTPDICKMFLLAEQYYETSRFLEETTKNEKWNAPRLMVDSFAVELYLKCLFVMDVNAAPPAKHDWLELFDLLGSHTKEAIREEFRHSINSHPVLSNLNVINPAAVKFTDFASSLAAAKDTFHKGRYAYESQLTDQWFYAHLLRDAIRTVTKMDLRIANC